MWSHLDSISIHAPTNGATPALSPALIPQIYFNPRSDERSDGISWWIPQGWYISIHAPTNGATKRYHKNYTLIKISIHAPTNGATFVQWILEKVSRISIHAPTNGATTTSTRVIIVDLFQSTLRRTERPSCAARLVSPTFISIHAPTNGSTELCSNNQQPAAISIHAPTNGATVQVAQHSGRTVISIHAPTNGATLSCAATISNLLLFQSTLRRTERRCI